MANPGINPRRVSPDYYMDLADPIAEVYRRTEDELLVNMAKRFKVDGGVIKGEEDLLRWQMRKLTQMGALDKESLAIIARNLGDIDSAARMALEQSAMDALRAADGDLLAAWRRGLLTGPREVRPITETLRRVLGLYEGQALDKLNLVNTVMLNSTRTAYIKTVTDIVRLDQQLAAGQRILNQQTGSVIMGVTSRQEAVRRAVTKMADEGLTGYVDRAGRQWSPEAYVNMDIRTTVHNVALAATDARNADYGNDLIHVDSHAGARPGCVHYQGKLYSTAGRSGTVQDGNGQQHTFTPLAATSYGRPDGLFGINCHHNKYVFAPGLTIPRHQPTGDLKRNQKIYEQAQQQRALERQVCNAKRRAASLQAAGDQEGAKKARQLVKQRQERVRAFAEETGRTRRFDREKVYGYDYGGIKN